MVVRQWEIVTELCQRRRGMTVNQLGEATGASRATLYRDLKNLLEAGVPINSERINGEMRYRLMGLSVPPLNPTPIQIAALHMARHVMTPLAGTLLVVELDRLLARYSLIRPPADGPLSIGPAEIKSWPGRVKQLDRAIHDGKRIAFDYQSVGQNQPRRRTVDPMSIHSHQGHLYLIAHDTERDALRTFKVARLSDIAMLDRPADPHPEYDEEALFAHAAQVWSGDPIPVAIRLTARVARFATEWPLSSRQTLDGQPDGSVIVRASVAGTVEAMRWTLRWGRDAEALSPPELRDAVKKQLLGAVEHY